MKKQKLVLTGLLIVLSLGIILVGIFVVRTNEMKASGAYIHYSRKVAVLEYHDIASKTSAYQITPQTFENEMKALQKYHYHIIPMKQFITFLNGNGTVPPNAVVLTFDDGYRSFYQNVYPVLQKMGGSATDFVIVGSTGKCSPWGLCHLTWDEMKEMKQHGFSFYSHTYDLHDDRPNGQGKNVPELANRIYLKKQHRLETDAEYRKRVLTDLSRADRILHSELGNQTDMLCFPHGAYNQELLELAHQDGIQYFFTGDNGLNPAGTHLIRRIDVGLDSVDAPHMIRILRQYDQNKPMAFYYKIRHLIDKAKNHL